ncbi:MAG TPA: polymer-forming cytoskeletal protein [Desulfobulbus sp.]|nr:polymer-forming cytoskeletal protein [Desulfobulbus sp.]
MALFSKKDTLKDEAELVSKEAISCIISKEMHIIGEIDFSGKARIDGTVDGNIKGEYLVLSETGRVNGNVELGALICHGTIEGDIDARLVTAHNTASIKGKLTSANLTVEPGASLEGEIHSTNSKNTAPVKGKTAGTGKDMQDKENKEGAGRK